MSTPQRTPSEERERLSAAVNGFDKIKIAAADHMTIRVHPCAGLDPVLPGGNIYTASSHFTMVPVLMSLPVSMTVYLCPATGEVTLFNALRVPSPVEDAILALGPVRHVVKLGQFHGAADAYYVRNPKFGSPRYWGAAGMTTAPGLAFTDTLAPGGNAPVAGADVVAVDSMPYPECVILAPVPGRPRALIVCDTLSHISSFGMIPYATRPVMWWLKFLCEDGVPVPPTLWLKSAVKLMGKEAVVDWFEKLFAMEWEALACAHGSSIAECDRSGLGKALKGKIEKAC